MSKENKNSIDLDEKQLKIAISKMFSKTIEDFSYESKRLHGGTLGDVQLISGTVKCHNMQVQPYKLVMKSQKKWKRFSDPNSWRREYDLYASDINHLFDESLRWAKCYHKTIQEDVNTLWLEYFEGATAFDLTVDMYEKAALELGRFQGKLFINQNASLKSIENLSTVYFLKNTYLHYRSWPEVYDFIRSDDCLLPQHLKNMLIKIDEQAEEIWDNIEKLPTVFCHRDYWITNIFHTPEGIRLIDWDTTGWGHLGEDIASLIIDESDVNHMVEYYKICTPAYYKGFSEYVDTSHIEKSYIYELILFGFGYRLVETFKFAKKESDRELAKETLEQVYKMGMLNLKI